MDSLDGTRSMRAVAAPRDLGAGRRRLISDGNRQLANAVNEA